VELVEEPEVDSEAAVSLAVEADHLSEPGEAPGVDSAVADEEDREEDLVAEVEANDDTEVYLFLSFFDLFSFSALSRRCVVTSSLCIICISKSGTPSFQTRSDMGMICVVFIIMVL
jgi:hypothetical protein